MTYLHLPRGDGSETVNQGMAPGESIVSRFEFVARRFPQRVALASDQWQPTFAELNAAANAWARELGGSGGSARDCAVVLMQHGAPVVAAALALLKAGRIVVVLNPADPAVRLRQAIEDADPSLIVADLKHVDRARQSLAGKRRVHLLDELSRDVESINASAPMRPEDVAYLIYTSGSTGRAKGVMQTHRNLLHQVRKYSMALELRPDDRVGLFASLGTGQGMSTTWCTLLNGAALYPYPIAERGVADLADWIEEHKITVCVCATSLFRCLTSTLPSTRRLDCVRVVRLGAEPATHVDFEAFKSHFADHCTLIHTFSSSETGNITQLRLTQRDAVAKGRLPVGRPAEGMNVWIVDDQGRQAPSGETGEIVVSGDYLSPGYWRDEAMTAQCFTSHGSAELQRCFRGGDVGRITSDGLLVHLGRKDSGVKIRGNRVDLGEVEDSLRSLPAVADAAVIAVDDGDGDLQLAAYFTRRCGESTTLDELRRLLGDALPAYMVPSALFELDAIPLLPNGKLDRRSLPRADAYRDLTQTALAPPRTPLEQELASIWREVLHVADVGLHDDFFQLGGHSLRAMQAVARMGAALGVRLPPAQVFRAPTIAKMAAAIEQLQRQPADEPRATPLERLQLATAPLSFSQEGLWLHEQLDGEHAAYNMCSAYRLDGALDVRALACAFQSLVDRHEALRTNYDMRDGEPRQIFPSHRECDLSTVDCSFAAASDVNDLIQNFQQQELDRRFDLRSDLMLRGKLIRFAADRHVLLLTVHHIASDASSMQILLRELSALYEAYSQGTSASLPSLALQYSDYAVWQRALAERSGEQFINQWREALSGLAPLDIPADRPRPPALSYRGASLSFHVSTDLTAKLRQLSQDANATLHMTLLALFQLLASRYSGQEDVVVGVPVSRRSDARLESLVGCFVNILPMRVHVLGGLSFAEFLERVRQASIHALERQDAPFARLVEALQPERLLGRAPLFQVIFQFVDDAVDPVMLGPIKVSRLSSSKTRARYDLEMQIRAIDQGLEGTIVYSADLFDAATIEQFIGCYQTLMQGVVAAPQQTIGRAPLLSEDQKRQIVVEWNAGNDAALPTRRVHELFEAQAEQSPDAAAVEFQRRHTTYRQLDDRANELAHELRRLGVGSGDVVGLCVTRSPELAVGVIGILKAGAAYVPLDLDLPSGRLEFMAQDAALRCYVTQRSLVARAPWMRGNTVFVDDPAGSPPNSRSSRPQTERDGEDIAYVMYTSGSTGQPKGVAMPHRALANLIEWQCRDARLGRPARTLQFASCGFDVSFQEMFTTWRSGGTLVMVGDDVRRDPDALRQFIVDSHVERLFIPYVALQQLAARAGGAATPLRDVISAGEALQLTPEIRRFIEAADDCRLHNHYGPTECHVVTSYALGRSPTSWPAVAPIGRPIANVQAYILDALQQPTPIGVPGELHLGGVCLAQGYLNRPELTAERFVDNPFSGSPESRLYRTGDRCRWRFDGNIEFLGRLDRQVKMRGYRVEPAEIEALINQEPDVASCAVVVREDHPGEAELVGYCVAAEGASLDFAALSARLRERLPDYMTPTELVALSKIPLTANGKLDYEALPPPAKRRRGCIGAISESRTPTERRLSRIWSETLRLDAVGVDESFFELGGHSLMAVRLFDRIEQTFGRKLPLATLYQHGTIRGIARILDECAGKREFVSVVSLQPDGAGRPLIFMPSIGGELLYARDLVNELGKRRPIVGLQPALSSEFLARFANFELTASGYLTTLRTFLPHGPYALVGYSYGGLLAYEIACQLDRVGEKVDLLAILDTGPGNRGRPRQRGDRRRWIADAAANLPHWAREEWRDASLRRLAGSAWRRLARLARHAKHRAATRGRSPFQVDIKDVFDVSQIPLQSREVMRAVYAAFRDYAPPQYSGKVTLLRASARALLGGFASDAGWLRFAKEVEIRRISGNHDSILHPPRVGALARQMGALLEALD